MLMTVAPIDDKIVKILGGGMKVSDKLGFLLDLEPAAVLLRAGAQLSAMTRTTSR